MAASPPVQPPRDGDGAPRTVANSEGGRVFAVPPRIRLLRFLILGNQQGTYYARAAADEADALAALADLIDASGGPSAVRLIEAVSQAGRAKAQRGVLLALAACAASDDEPTAMAAHDALPAVARTPTMFFEYLSLRQAHATRRMQGRGWGRRHRRLVRRWYCTRGAMDLAKLVTKYRRRCGYTHRDALHLGHVRPPTAAHQALFRYAAGKPHGVQQSENDDDARAVGRYLDAIDEAARQPDTAEGHSKLVALIREFKLVHEHIPQACLGAQGVWAALLPAMPLGALIRNLNRLTAVGVIGPDQPHATQQVANRLQDAQGLRKARIHPMAVLLAHRTYAQGRGERGGMLWAPCDTITRALDRAFVASFAAVVPTGQRVVVALDVSGSMMAPCSGASAMSCAEAAAAMAVVTARTEPCCTAMCFAHTFESFPLTRHTSLSEATSAMRDRAFGMTDCSLPMQWAETHGVDVDLFIVYTDSETCYGNEHPSRALQRYRSTRDLPHAKLAVVGMASNGFTIADPNDAGMLDVVGFDAGAPDAIAEFARGFQTPRADDTDHE